MSKEVKTTVADNNFYLSVFLLLKQGVRPSKICSRLSISKQALNYYLATLKSSGFIQKVGYGVWEILKDFEVKEVKKSVVIGTNSRGGIFTSLKPDQVRGHAFLFKLKLPENLRNWERREEIFTKQGIEFKPYFVGGVKRGQQIKFKDKVVQLTDGSIIIQVAESYVSETAKEAKSSAVYDFLSVVKSLEGYLGAAFTVKGNYQFKVSRQHYALIKNALAKQYDKEGKKLEVYNTNGLWFIIDNSFNLHEAETVHPVTADGDNKKVQDFFNGVKALEGFTPQFVVNSIGQSVQQNIQLSQNLEQYAIHLKAHVESVQKLGVGVEELVKVVKELKNGNN
jgi:hypothetical protein